MTQPAIAPVTLLHAVQSHAPGSRLARATFVGLDDGRLIVTDGDGAVWRCDWLERGGAADLPLQPGDVLLVLLDPQGALALGRVGVYRDPRTQAPDTTLCLEAATELQLRCGDASLTLRQDGKVLLKGDDVLLHATTQQRIRAGTVSIN